MKRIDAIAAVFVGGSDVFKISAEAMAACKAAKMMGKWVHVGRVNTAKRVRDWLGVADSIDGSGISMYDHMLEDVLTAIRGEHPQHALFVEDKPWVKTYAGGKPNYTEVTT